MSYTSSDVVSLGDGTQFVALNPGVISSGSPPGTIIRFPLGSQGGIDVYRILSAGGNINGRQITNDEWIIQHLVNGTITTLGRSNRVDIGIIQNEPQLDQHGEVPVRENDPQESDMLEVPCDHPNANFQSTDGRCWAVREIATEDTIQDSLESEKKLVLTFRYIETPLFNSVAMEGYFTLGGRVMEVVTNVVTFHGLLPESLVFESAVVDTDNKIVTITFLDRSGLTLGLLAAIAIGIGIGVLAFGGIVTNFSWASVEGQKQTTLQQSIKTLPELVEEIRISVNEGVLTKDQGTKMINDIISNQEKIIEANKALPQPEGLPLGDITGMIQAIIPLVMLVTIAGLIKR